MPSPDLLSQLRAATIGLEYPSESDAEVRVRVFQRPFPWRTDALPTERVDVHTFFQPLLETDAAPAWHALHLLLAGSLDDLQVYRVGETRVSIFIVGRDKTTHETIGLETLSIET